MRSPEEPVSTRRRFLATVGAAAVAPLGGCAASSTDASPDPDDLATADTPEEPTRTTVVTATDSDTTPAVGDSFAEATIERARETGIAVRDSVLAMSPDPPAVGGTGWYFDAADVVVTAGHLFAVEQDDWVAWQSDGARVDLDYLDDAYLDGADVGAARADGTGPPLSAGTADDLEPGEPLVQVGHPSGVGNWVISLGRYRGETDGEADGFLTSVPGEGGASGSPTLTLDGEVVGLVSGVEFVDPRAATTGTPSTPLYGPGDRLELSEHVGIGAITDRVEEWTDA